MSEIPDERPHPPKFTIHDSVNGLSDTQSPWARGAPRLSPPALAVATRRFHHSSFDKWSGNSRHGHSRFHEWSTSRFASPSGGVARASSAREGRASEWNERGSRLGRRVARCGLRCGLGGLKGRGPVASGEPALSERSEDIRLTTRERAEGFPVVALLFGVPAAEKNIACFVRQNSSRCRAVRRRTPQDPPFSRRGRSLTEFARDPLLEKSGPKSDRSRRSRSTQPRGRAVRRRTPR